MESRIKQADALLPAKDRIQVDQLSQEIVEHLLPGDAMPKRSKSAFADFDRFGC